MLKSVLFDGYYQTTNNKNEFYLRLLLFNRQHNNGQIKRLDIIVQ